MGVMLLIFGILESKVYLNSIILCFITFILFVILILYKRQIVFGGGDIKYIMIVALFLNIEAFGYFLFITGIFQSLLMIFFNRVLKRNIVPMVPSMFLSVIIIDIYKIWKELI